MNPSSPGSSPPANDVHAGSALFCLTCGYDLHGRSSDHCPECGADLAYLNIASSRIAWAHRRELGSVWAYYNTAFTATLWPRRFCEEYFRPQDYASASRFRWITSLGMTLAALSLALTPYGVRGFLGDLGGLELALLLTVGPITVFLCTAAAAQVSGIFFQRPGLSAEQQDRGALLSLYACAPLAWSVPLALALLAAQALAVRTGSDHAELYLEGTRLWTPAALWVAWWFLLQRMSAALHRREGWDKRRMALGLLMLWGLVGGLILVLVPAAVVWLAIVALSFA